MDAPGTNDLDGRLVVGGSSTIKTLAVYTSNERTMISNIREATLSAYHATYTAYEFVNLIYGKITIIPEGGEALTLEVGDAFFVKSNFKGI